MAVAKRRTFEPSAENPGSDNAQMEADKARQKQEATRAGEKKKSATYGAGDWNRKRAYQHRAISSPESFPAKGSNRTTGFQSGGERVESISRDFLKSQKAKQKKTADTRRAALKRRLQGR